MKEPWHDLEFATRWDQEALAGNPSRREQLNILLSILKSHCQVGDCILDLGIGSAQVEAMIFSQISSVQVVGVDSSPAMLSLARERLASLRISKEQCSLVERDLGDTWNLPLRGQPYRAIIGIQSLHHLQPAIQYSLVQHAFEALVPGGLLLVLDRIAIDAGHLSKLYGTVWDCLEQDAEVKNNWSSEQFLRSLEHKDDYPLELEKWLEWMRRAGFYAACLHLSLNRALFAGVKL